MTADEKFPWRRQRQVPGAVSDGVLRSIGDLTGIPSDILAHYNTLAGPDVQRLLDTLGSGVMEQLEQLEPPELPEGNRVQSTSEGFIEQGWIHPDYIHVDKNWHGWLDTSYFPSRAKPAGNYIFVEIHREGCKVHLDPLIKFSNTDWTPHDKELFIPVTQWVQQ